LGGLEVEVAAAAFNPSDAEAYLKRSASKVFYSDQAELKDFEASVYSQAFAVHQLAFSILFGNELLCARIFRSLTDLG